MAHKDLIYMKSYESTNKSKARKDLELLGIEFNNDGNIVKSLKTQDGTDFGKVTYDAYKAIESGTLDSYKPKNDEEKNIISNYRKHPSIPLKAEDGKEFGKISYNAYKALADNKIDGYTPQSDAESKVISEFKTYAETKSKELRINSNPTFARYNIDPDSFTFNDLVEWAKEHNHHMNFSASTMQTTFAPNYEGGFLGIGAKKLSSDQEDADMKVLYQLALNNQRQEMSQTDFGAFMSGVVGFADGLTFGGASALSDWSIETAYKKAGLDPNNLVTGSDMYAKTVNEHKVANVGGDVVGSVVSLGALGKGVSAATKGVKWISSSPQWVQSAINSGITFGVAGGVETAFDGGDLKDVLISTGTNFVGGAVGGAVSSKVGSIGEKILFNKGLQHKIIPEMIRNGFASAAFAGGKATSTYFLYPEEYRPTAEELTKDIAVAFAFGAISSGINTIKTSAQNKKYLDDLYQKMASDYESMARANISSKSDITGIRKYAKNVIAYSNTMEAYLTGKEYSTTIDGSTYTFAPNKIRLVGQDKYVKSILSELQTVRSNANAVLNGVGTPSTDLATTSTTPTSSGTSTSAIVPTLSGSSGTTSETPVSVPPVVSTPTTSTPVASTSVTTPITPIADTSSSAAPVSMTGESGEMSTGAVTQFTPETASDEIKKVENILVKKGVDDVSRQEIISTALEIEKALVGSNKTITSVFNDVSGITSSAVSKIKSKAGVSGAYWGLFRENLKSIQSGSVVDNIELVTEYVNAYTEALKNSNPEKYNSVIVATDGTDLVSELPKTIMQNVIPANAQNAGEYKLVASHIKNIVSDVDVQISSERAEIYGKENTSATKPVDTNNQYEKVLNAESEEAELMATDMEDVETAVAEAETPAETVVPQAETSKNIALTRVGEFYEAYGNSAVQLSESLELTPFRKVVNGVETTAVGFPVRYLDSYTNKLGDGYNFTITETPTTATTETENSTVTEESVVGNNDLPEAFRYDENGNIRFNQMDIDYTNTTMRKGQFRIAPSNSKDAKFETVDGTLCGKYGISKLDSTDKYAVYFLQAGKQIEKFDTLTEAKKVAKYLDENLSFNDVIFYKGFSGDLYMKQTDEFKEYLSEAKRIITNKEYKTSTPAVTEIQDGKVPFNTKAQLVEYVKSHIGDKVKVTFNNGNSEVRTLSAISNTTLRTKREDGSIVSSELKGVKYNDNGIYIDFKNGVAVTFDFVNVDNAKPVETEAAKDIETATKKSSETEEAKADRKRRNLEAQKSRFGLLSPERQEYLKDKYNEHREVLEKVKTGDLLIDEDGNIIAEASVDNELGIMMVGEQLIEQIPVGFFMDDTVYGFLEMGGKFVSAQEYAEMTKPTTDTKSAEEVLNNQPESDTIEEKPDLKVGDVIEHNGKRWKVKSTGFNMSFENLDKDDMETSFSHIGGMESFKNTHDYSVVSENTTPETSTVEEKAVAKTEAKGEDVAQEQPDNATMKNRGTQAVAKFVAAKLKNGKKISALELSKVANVAFGGTMADNAYSIKDAYDAMELGVNQHILSMKDVSAEKMLELLELLPTQTKRTEEMVKFQQFSTPPSIAYLANYTANVNSNDIMLEPSAGIGGIAVFAKKDGAKVYVNELDNRRLEVLKNMPFDGFFNEDAEQIDNILGGELEPTVIVMNPPFSSSAERNMHKTKIGAKHIEQALKILAPNGRLVAIVGKGMADGEPAFRDWWKNIKSEYNVRANIGINGKNYNKYGTNFDIQMLVIDKNGPTENTVTGYVDTLQELQDKLGGIRDERPAIDYSANEQRTPATTRTEVAQTGKTADNGNSVVSDTGSVDVEGKPKGKRGTSGKSNDQNIQSTDAEHGKPSSTTSENTDVVADEDGRVGSRQSDGLDGKENSVGVDNSDSGQSDIQTGRTEPRKRVKRKELTDSIFEQYQTQPLRVKNAQPHPAKVSESAAMSAIEPPAITYAPKIPQDIIDKGVVSAVQLEAISYAGQSHSQTLPNGTTRGFFLGDGTGIGKGRTIAGMILDNYNQGRKKSVWVTLNSSLVNDAKRDVKALFGNSDLVTQFVGGNKADSVLNTDEAIMVISYSTLAKGFDNKDSNFEKLVKWLGKDFDGLIVFDEAHKMGNATSTKGTRGMKKASQTGIAGISLQEALPKAKIVYSSATGATEVENLRYAERLGLWGEGTPFIKGDDFVSKVKAGGLAAMELIARDMKAMGVYLSRNISYDDVQYDKITHNLTAPQTKIYDELARSWQIVLQNINKALESTNQDKDGHARGRALGAFWSSQQRFFNQILTSMQVPSVISDIEKQLADGKSCVIQLVSTNEAAQNQEFERLKSEDLELDEFDLTPKQVLMSLIENSFPVQQFEEYRDDNGNVRSRPVFDSKGNPVINREAVEQRKQLLDKLGSIKVPSSPIDMIINHFGTDLVAENTGRARRVIQKDGKPVEEKIGSKKDADVDAFQNGNKRIIIFSKAGGTGKSYHADRSAKNQQQRVHYLLEAGWQADNAVQGFGRSHRSNQVSAPIFKLVTTDLKGQMRFISTIAKRLDQLGAMTKGQRQAGSQGMFSASDNLENSFAADVLAGFYKDLVSNRVDGIDDGLAILEKLGLKGKILDEYGRIIPTATELREVNKFLNRILSLESSEQNTVFEGYSQRLQDATEKALQAGTLDKGLENYKADKIMLNEVQDIREDERSGAKTKYYNLTAEHKIKPIKFTDVPTGMKSFVGFYQNKNTGGVRAVFQTSSTTDKFGNVTSNYKLMGQTRNEYIPQYRFHGNWTALETDDAQKLWNDEVSNLPEYRQENLHLISGVVLPVWDKLPTENVRIYRVLTSDGEMLIGRVVPENMIDETLRRLGSSRTKEKISTKDLIAGIKSGNTVYLDNGWSIVQRKVANENRIEIIGPSYEHYDLLIGKGVFTERIQYNTRYFVPANTNTEKIIDDILKISPVMRVESEKISYSLESEGFDNEQTGSLLSDGIGERSYSPSTKRKTKSLDGRSSRYRERRKTARERRKYCQTLKDAGHTEQKIIYGHECEVIPAKHHTPRMTGIAEQNQKDGIDETVFVTGKFTIPFAKDKNGNPKKSKGAYIKANGKKIVIVQYDNEFYLPEQINDHEKIHDRYHTTLVQKARNIIMNSLPVAEKRKVLENLTRDYNGIIEGNEEAIIEEFVANVLSDMDYEHFRDFAELQRAYWKGDEQFIDNYKVSEYTESTDAGGANVDMLDSIGFGNEFRLSESYGNIPFDEYMQLREYIVTKNNKDVTLLSRDCKEIGNNLYIWRNAGKMDFIVVDSIPIEGNHDAINSVRSDIENGTIRGAKSIGEWSANIRGGKRSSTVLDSRIETTTPNRSDDKLSVGQSESDTLGYLAESSRTEGKQLKSVDSTDGENIIVRYSTSIDDDIAELTPERKKEIFEQFERDRVGVDKPTQKQIWGERAEWIAHNMTRVFPEIPERGEKGTFFAEFRKMMIQWKALPQTSMFMTQDKLNQMTKDLTPDEFKTFSELVYFLDLQEEAQIQKERGYTEILLPNEISPHEVDQIVDVLNKEATDNVKKALEKRSQIWDNLKEQYITLNQYVGFDTGDKFKRKNYYHHQVIEYMNQGGKGVAKGKDIEIKAGRGWLKERQGSTMAINTDFLAVEYKAMLQMQYDVYVANMLGKIKDQYDIKPQLEKQAFNHNKSLINQMIADEATDENGNVMLDNKGKPDSETYRQQQWYNQRIMFGFSGLFELAEADVLPTLGGQYGNVIQSLKAQNLNAAGLYNYVGELASMELPETATDEEHQAQISARTVLKYTSQKKAWVKETLADEYQTWETLANDMKDTHSIHQPRRGNYFYTKEVVNEDAFNKAFNDMITGLVAGENGINTTADLKKLFEQYSETIRQIGAAYEQWVIPNEVETTMNKVANPKQTGVVSQGSRAILSAWKGWATSVNPLRTVEFGIRNLFGDLDAVIAGKPQLVRYSKQAVNEIYQAMKHKKYSPEFMEWVERGGYSSLIFANEMDTEMQDKIFSHLKNKEGINIFKIPAKLFEGYYNGVENAHNFREAILRYSAYLYFKNDIIKNDGNIKDNIASNRYIVKGLKSVEDKAYQLSKDLLGAYDEVATMGQALRRHAVPFYSFTETNLKRYYRLFENIIMSDDTIPKKAGKLLLKGLMVNMLALLMVAWNKLVMKDEDDELPPSVRNIPHITFGRIGDDSHAFRQLGSFSELLEWVGLEDYQWTKEDLTAPLDKAVGMITPVVKTPVELLTGLNFYPSITQPRAIRDKWEHFFSTLGVDEVYRVVAGKPNKGVSDIIKGSVIYSYDYKESAYYEILDIKRKYQGDTDNTIYGQTPKSNALYYMKTAIRYKDKDAALKYLDDYFENGGTAKGITQSIEMLNPMYGYTGKDTIEKGKEFVASLSEEEKDKLKIAQDYYEKDLMLPENVSAMLRKKGITDEQAKNLLTKYINSKCSK